MAKKRGANFHSGQFGAAISLQVKPGAKKNSIREIRSDGLVVVKLASTAVDISSNPILLSFLASLLGVDRSNIDIVAGELGEYKLVSIVGMDSQRVDELLHLAVSKSS